MSGDADGLTAHLVVRRETFALDLRLHVDAGEVVALLGPNGAGKSTALRALAGLLRLAEGSVELEGRVLEDARTGTRVPTEHRPVGFVFQDYLLFPHLSVLENVAFGPRARGADKSAARARARHWLERVGLVEYAGARPRSLSGGQAQRVALARALASDPRMLLLDEPLAALDASTRMEVRSDLRRHLHDYTGTTVLVTHDPLDAMVLADRLVVVEGGQVVQEGTPAQVARAPRTDYVARLVGLNLYRGWADGHSVAVFGGGSLTVAEPASGDVFVAFAPSAVALFRSRPQGTPRNAWPGRVAALEQHGETVRVRLDAQPPVLADVTTAAVADLDLAVGNELWAVVKAQETHAYPV